VTLTATCPQCGYRAEAPDGAAGGAVACPECAARFLLPRVMPAAWPRQQPTRRPHPTPLRLQLLCWALSIILGMIALYIILQLWWDHAGPRY
jgi:DNA-directed RNA polymerase subunit RPC12/RpoP